MPDPAQTTIITSKKFDTASIEKLDGDNYRMWRRVLMCLFNSHEIMGIVDGTEARPAAAGDGQKKWDKGNNDAITTMMLSMSRTEVDSVSGCDTAAEIWTKLETMYHSTSGESKQALLQKFYCVMATPGKSPMKTMVEIQGYAAQLRTVGVTISDDMVVARIISSLMDEKYRNFREAWRSVEIGKQTTALLLSRLKTWELEDEEQGKTPKESGESVPCQ